jgi:hypothetical protein
MTLRLGRSLALPKRDHNPRIALAGMRYVQFGNMGMEVQRYCLGAMTFGRQLDLDGSRRVVEAVRREPLRPQQS